MNIGREPTILNKHWNSLIDWNNFETSIKKWKGKSWKMINFIKDSSVKYLIPALVITFWWIKLAKRHSENTNCNKDNTPLLLEKDDTDCKINPLTIDIPKFLSDNMDENVDDNARGVMYDEGYDQNYISGIPLDEELDYAPWTHILQTTKENLYRTIYKKLSFKNYQELFKWLKNLKQWYLGNCYFIVAIKNLARSKYFDTLMMTSVERTGKESFNLYMPLWEPWWMKISITSEDLKATTIWWPLWYKILEIWFAKYLLFKKKIINTPDFVMAGELMKKMEVWSPWETMMSLLWPKSFINKCIRNEASNRLRIINWLRNYDPKNLWTISATSKFKEWKTDKNCYEVWWETVYYGHAYCICGIEKEWDIIKSITLENPWNRDNKKWWRKIKLSIEDFLNSFSLINFGHMTDNFLNLWTLPDETKIIDSRDRRKS